jgi:alcohol dehydrogenase
VVGAEASGEIAAVGAGVTRFTPGQKVVMYGALTCGTCPACQAGRDNLARMSQASWAFMSMALRAN